MTTTTNVPQRYADDVSKGDSLESFDQHPTTVQLFRYCSTTWNSHRIHYDKDYAASEGYPDVLVQSHLHGAFMTTLADRFAGDEGRILRLFYSVRRFAVPGDVLTLEGEITDAEKVEGGTKFALDIREVRKSDDTVCVTGKAEVFLPYRGGSDAPRGNAG